MISRRSENEMTCRPDAMAALDALFGKGPLTEEPLTKQEGSEGSPPKRPRIEDPTPETEAATRDTLMTTAMTFELEVSGIRQSQLGYMMNPRRDYFGQIRPTFVLEQASS